MGIKEFFQRIFPQKELKLEPGLCLVDIELVNAAFLAMTGKTLEQGLMRAIEVYQDEISCAENNESDAMTAQEALIKVMNAEIQRIRERHAPEIQALNTTVLAARNKKGEVKKRIQDIQALLEELPD